MKIIVTAGPTREYIDDVRFISNASSGRMGYAIAVAAARRGHEVDLVTGPVDIALPGGVNTTRVVSAEEMRRTVLGMTGAADALVMAAAVSDWRPKRPFRGKTDKGPEEFSLELVRNPDILREATRRNPGMLAVAFALETDMDRESALRKMTEKGASYIVLNTIGAMGAGEAEFAVYSTSGKAVVSGRYSKERLAEALVDIVEKETAG